MARKTSKKKHSLFTKIELFLIMAVPVLALIQIGVLSWEKYINTLRPKDFTTNITNKYYSLPIGKKFVYEARTDEGLERDEVWTTGETKVVAGVTTLVVYDRVTLNGKLIEDTKDYLAQHKNGDLWYFGEDVTEIGKTGKISHEGAWLTGVNGGQPGIWVKANPKVGESYRQEYLKGEAEDNVTTTSINETVTVRGHTYTNCMKTHEWTPLNPAALEDKYYCPEVNTTVLEVDLADGERAELVEII